MDIPSATAATTPQTGTAVTDAKGKAAISSDFDTFLKMLTVQMQNQDPLNPIDSSDYAVQLATFSGVEQQVKTNDLLTSLAAQMSTSGMSQMASWVGMEARVAAPVQFSGQPITIAPNPPVMAERVDLVVRNASGTEVERRALPVYADPVQWTGERPDGTFFPPGLYSFEVVSSAGEEVLTTDQAQVYARVQEVRNEGGQTYVMLPGDIAVPTASVSALRDPAYF